MAYLDDNNDIIYTQGNLLEDLDKELAELNAALEELDGPAPDAQASDENAPKEEKTVSQEPDL